MYREEDIPLYPSLNDDLKGRPDIYHSENAVGLSKDNRLIQPTPLSDDQWRKMLRYAYAENTLADAAAGRIVDKIFSLGLDKDTLIVCRPRRRALLARRTHGQRRLYVKRGA